MTLASVPLTQTRAWDCRVAVELVRIGEVAGSVDRFGDRYLRRVYTEHELSTCGSVPGSAEPSGDRRVGLAARFAAKAATLKVLETCGVKPDLRSVEVVHHPEGAYGVKLTGAVAKAATELGIGRISVSLSNGGGTASAVVTAICDEEPIRSPDRLAARPEPSRRDDLDDGIRAVLDEHGQLIDDATSLGDDHDLSRSGLTSHASVNVLLALEEAFGVTLPPSMTQAATFRSIATIRATLAALLDGDPVLTPADGEELATV
jgi:phosphopantetheine--protein transferase-like protein